MRTFFKVTWSVIKFLCSAIYAGLEAIVILFLVLMGPVGWFILFLCWMGDRSDRISKLEKEVAVLRMAGHARKG